MGEASNGVEEPPVAPTPRLQQAIAAPVPPSASANVDNANAPDSGNADKTGAAAGDEEARPTQGRATAEADAAASATGTRTNEETGHGTTLSSPATPPKTPERDVAPPTRPGERALADEVTAPVVDTAKPGGCTTPPVHDLEGSDGWRSADSQYGSPLHGEKEKPKPVGVSVKRDVVASKSRLLTSFRSFSRDKKVDKPGDAPGPRLAPAEPRPPVHGKGVEDGAEHKDKGKERRKWFWK